mmetsp:Transcript_8191/g.16548  ORF Transcript_8191/g.16548 Transcript_8191/m.16548 type:complete len:107 (+) Transcript_8191:1941-2261(+)
MEEPDIVMREVARRRELEAEKQRRADAVRQAEMEALERGRTAPKDWFRFGPESAKYSEWDDEGMPTKLSDGQEVTKSGRKKLEKERDRQAKLHQKFLEARAAGNIQ